MFEEIVKKLLRKRTKVVDNPKVDVSAASKTKEMTALEKARIERARHYHSQRNAVVNTSPSSMSSTRPTRSGITPIDTTSPLIHQDPYPHRNHDHSDSSSDSLSICDSSSSSTSTCDYSSSSSGSFD